MMRSLVVGPVVALMLLGPALLPAREAPPAEKQKIEALIKHVEGLTNAKFVRNDTEYDAKAAARFLRGKWDSAGADIKTAKDFIDKAASKSSTTGKPYLIRFKGGKEMTSADYFLAELKKLDGEKRGAPAPAGAAPADGFVPLFNGRDLSGWVNVNCHPGTFFVKGNEIVTTGQPIGYLRTERMYENFVAEFEWMHVNTKEVGNSGFFVWGDPLPVVGSPFTRGIEVQVLVNLEYKDPRTGAVTATSHGDVFSIQGATCKPDRPHPRGTARCLPSEYRAKGGGEWNHYKIIANDGTIKLHVNGKEVSGVSACKPRKGYLALESEGAECHFRNLKIKELPSTNPKPEETAEQDKGFVSLFTGLDLAGWKTDKDAWKVAGGALKAAGKADLESEKAYGPGELLFDWKVAVLGKQEAQYSAEAGGKKVTVGGKAGGWNRSVLRADAAGPVRFPGSGAVEIRNVFYRDAK